MKPVLIAFTGKAGCGKDTAADYLASSRRYYKASFADKMKDGVAKMFDLPDSAVRGTKEEKEAIIPHLSKTKPVSARFLMQTLATEWARDVVDPDIWIYEVDKKWQLMKSIPGFTGMVISDLRFDNEAEWVHRNGGIVIEVKSPASPILNGLSYHTSEQGVNPCLVNNVIINYKSGFEEFHKQIDLVADETLAVVSRFHKACADEQRNRESTGEHNIKDLIVGWADSVFPHRTITNAITKLMLHEIPEYMMKQDDPMELADIGILLYDIANLAGIDLDEAIRAKMEINKSRTWCIDSNTGLMSHVKVTPITNQTVKEATIGYMNLQAHQASYGFSGSPAHPWPIDSDMED